MNLSKKEMDYYFLDIKTFKKLTLSFLHNNLLYKLISYQKESYLISSKSTKKFSFNILKAFYADKDESLIFITKNKIIIFSLKMMAVLNEFEIDFGDNSIKKKDIIIGDFDECEYFLILQDENNLDYFYFDFFEIFHEEIEFDSNLVKIEFNSENLFFVFKNKIIINDFYIENENILNLRKNQKYLFNIDNKIFFKEKKNMYFINYEESLEKKNLMKVENEKDKALINIFEKFEIISLESKDEKVIKRNSNLIFLKLIDNKLIINYLKSKKELDIKKIVKSEKINKNLNLIFTKKRLFYFFKNKEEMIEKQIEINLIKDSFEKIDKEKLEKVEADVFRNYKTSNSKNMFSSNNKNSKRKIGQLTNRRNVNSRRVFC